MEEDPDHLEDDHDSLVSKAEVARRIYDHGESLHSEPSICSAAMDWIHRYWVHMLIYNSCHVRVCFTLRMNFWYTTILYYQQL